VRKSASLRRGRPPACPTVAPAAATAQQAAQQCIRQRRHERIPAARGVHHLLVGRGHDHPPVPPHEEVVAVRPREGDKPRALVEKRARITPRGSLTRVGPDHVGGRQESRSSRPRRRTPEERWGAVQDDQPTGLVTDPGGRNRHRDRLLQLHKDGIGGGHGSGRGLHLRRRQQRQVLDVAVLRPCVQQFHDEAGQRAAPAYHCGHVDPVGAGLVQQHVADHVVAGHGQQLRAYAQLGQRHRLVGALAAELFPALGGVGRRPRLGQGVDREHQIAGQLADHGRSSYRHPSCIPRT
jgi:hypothetical protein